jgi:hypothetical protein
VGVGALLVAGMVVPLFRAVIAAGTPNGIAVRLVYQSDITFPKTVNLCEDLRNPGAL